MLLTQLCEKKELSAYDKLVGEVGYFDAPTKKANVTAPAAAKPAQKLIWKNIPQTVEALVARLNADKARVDAMTDAFGKEITLNNIAALSAFLASNGVAI